MADKQYKVFKKVPYGVLGILLGGFGVNSFIAGNIGKGILKIILCWTGIPAIIGLIQGIIALCRPEERLIQTGVFKFEGADPVPDASEYSGPAPVFRITGVQDELMVFENKLSITPKGALGFLNKGMQGTKTIQFTSITAIQFKMASAYVSGYLQFSILGGRENTMGILGAATDENTFMFSGKETNKLAEEIKNYIEDRMHTSMSVPASGVSQADEVAKLFEMKKKGVISEEDFVKAKKRLLGT